METPISIGKTNPKEYIGSFDMNISSKNKTKLWVNLHLIKIFNFVSICVFLSNLIGFSDHSQVPSKVVPISNMLSWKARNFFHGVMKTNW